MATMQDEAHAPASDELVTSSFCQASARARDIWDATERGHYLFPEDRVIDAIRRGFLDGCSLGESTLASEKAAREAAEAEARAFRTAAEHERDEKIAALARVKALEEAGQYLIDTYKRLWMGGVSRDLDEAEEAWKTALTNGGSHG